MIAFLTNPVVLSFIVGLITFLIGKFIKKLPLNAQKFFNKIGGMTVVIALLKEAEIIVSLDADGKRVWVKTHLKEVYFKLTDMEMPDAIANLIVEFCYNEYAATIGKK
jgi:hypothetical protein